MALTKEQFQQIHDALLDGYNELALRQMVRLRLGEDLDLSLPETPTTGEEVE
jgi:hypothetical protein